MTRLSQCIAALVLSLAAGASFAAQSCKPVVGHFEAQAVPPGQGHCPNVPDLLCTAGRVWGGIQGNYQFVVTGAVPSATIGGVATILFFTGKSTISLKSGDLLTGTDTGSLDLPPGQGGFASLITFDGERRLSRHAVRAVRTENRGQSPISYSHASRK